MSDPLRVAVVGYGLAGRWLHRPLVQSVPDLLVTHVVTSDPARRGEALGDLPGVTVVPTIETLWEHADAVDVVVVASATRSHLEVATAAIAHGKTTVVDKPVALTAADAEQLAAQATRCRVVLAPFHNRRWDSDTLTVRRLRAAGAFGDVVRFESRFQRFRPKVADRWREAPAEDGGGVLLDLGTHLVDQARYLFGPVARVYAEVDMGRSGAVTDDDCFLALEHVNGTRSHLWCSIVAPSGGPRIRLEGTRAGYVKDTLDGQEQALRAGRALPVAEPAGLIRDHVGVRAAPSVPGDWRAFYVGLVSAVRGRGGVPVEPADAVAGLRIIEAARRSAQLREVVML